MNTTMLKSLRIRNFKAIRDSGLLKLTPLTVFIGNNGSGKSSVLEALETLQRCLEKNIDAAMQMWRGIEHVRNKSGQVNTESKSAEQTGASKPIVFELTGHLKPRGSHKGWPFKALSAWSERDAGNELFFEREYVRIGSTRRDRDGNSIREGEKVVAAFRADESMLDVDLGILYVHEWQFVSLSPQAMGNPVPQTRSTKRVRLAKDGSNIAQYLNEIRDMDKSAFEGILDAVRFVLPYAVDVQPSLTSELERAFYLKMKEQDFEVPGWLLSTGTLRVLALLALLRHPDPPPLLVIEEVENGLDPRTIHLLVEEIRAAVEAGKTQLIVTTHSPYLLDLLPLSAIVLVNRVDGEPRFTRPADNGEVRHWAKDFAPGQLYTMGRFQLGSQP